MLSPIGNIGLLVDRLRDLRRRLVVEGIEEDVMRVIRRNVLSTTPPPASDSPDWQSIFAGEKVRVVLPDSSHTEFRYAPNLLVKEVKIMLQTNLGIPIKYQVLYLHDSVSELEDDCNMEHYGIRPSTIVYISGSCFYVNDEGKYVFHIPLDSMS